MRGAARASARSSASEAILLTRTRVRPLRVSTKSGSTPNCVIVGPRLISTTCAGAPKEASVSSIRCAALFDEVFILCRCAACIQDVADLRQHPLDGRHAGRGRDDGSCRWARSRGVSCSPGSSIDLRFERSIAACTRSPVQCRQRTLRRRWLTGSHRQPALERKLAVNGPSQRNMSSTVTSRIMVSAISIQAIRHDHSPSLPG